MSALFGKSHQGTLFSKLVASSSFGSFTNIEGGSSGIARFDTLDDLIHSLFLDQGDSTATKATAGHSRSINSRTFQCQFHQLVQFGARHFIIIPEIPMNICTNESRYVKRVTLKLPQRIVTVHHQFPKSLVVLILQQFSSFGGSVNFRDNVSESLEHDCLIWTK